MNFKDYESSNITSQMTLVQKFNEILKFLRNADLKIGPAYYRHNIIIRLKDSAEVEVIKFSFISSSNESLNSFNRLANFKEELTGNSFTGYENEHDYEYFGVFDDITLQKITVKYAKIDNNTLGYEDIYENTVNLIEDNVEEM